MARALWKDTVIAESETFEEVEGNIYFPPDSVYREYLRESDTHTRCPWKGYSLLPRCGGRRRGQSRRRVVLPRP